MDAPEIIALFERLGAPRIGQPSNGNIQFSCLLAPWQHGGDGADLSGSGSFSVRINPDGPSPCCCFACSFRGTLASYVRTLDHYRGGDIHDVLKEVRKAEQGDLPGKLRRAAVKAVTREMWAPGERTWPESMIAPYLGKTPEYILDRGITLETARAWQIGYDPMRRRAVFPVRNKDRRLVGAIGRDITGKNPVRYYAYQGFAKGDYLYGMDKMEPGNSEQRRILLLESNIGAVRLWQAGYRNVLALMGTHLSEQQAKWARWHNLEVWIVLDGDRAGRGGVAAVAHHLLGRVPVYDCVVPDGKDPEDLAPDDLEKVLAARKLILPKG